MCCVLEKSGDFWAGSTLREGCASDHLGAVRVTSTATITREGTPGTKVGLKKESRGPETGPYKFRKINPQQVDPAIDQMAWRLSGQFDNSAQVAADPSFAPVDYSMCPVTIWGANWENTARSTLVRQAISLPNGRAIVRSRIYVLRPQSETTRAMEFWDVPVGSPIGELCLAPHADRVISLSSLTPSDCPMTFQWDASQRA